MPLNMFNISDLQASGHAAGQSPVTSRVFDPVGRRARWGDGRRAILSRRSAGKLGQLQVSREEPLHSPSDITVLERLYRGGLV